MDHSEVVAPELARRHNQGEAEREERIKAVVASRVPDIRFLLDSLLRVSAVLESLELDPEAIGLVGHSFGGWTALATPEADDRIRAVVALAPGGSTIRKPGILPVSLTFAWGHAVPTLYLAAELDVPIPLEAIHELFDRAPPPKRLFILKRADHQHFVDDVEGEHEAARTIPYPDEAAWIPRAMRSINELCTGEQAHLFVRGLTLAHLDATLRGFEAAALFMAGDVEAALEAHGVEAMEYRPQARFEGVSISDLSRSS
jgi:dienelactone hydrolase